MGAHGSISAVEDVHQFWHWLQAADPTGTNPTEVVDGQVWIDSTATPNTLKHRVAGAWVAIGSAAGLTQEQIEDFLAATTFVAGTNMTITYNDGAGTLTFDAAGGSYSTENAQDDVAGMMLNTSSVAWTYVDGTPSLAANVLDEYVQDLVAALLVAGTNMVITYADGTPSITFDASGGTEPVIPRVRREMSHLADAAAFTLTTNGWKAPTNTGLRAAVVGDDLGAIVDYRTTAATIGSTAKIVSAATATQRSFEPDWGCEIRTDPTSIADVRYWLGLGADQSATATLDTAATGAWFTYDSARDGTVFWRCVSDLIPNADVTTVTTVAVVAATRYRFRILMDATHNYFYINDVLVATHTTNLSAAATVLNYTVTITTLANAFKSFWFAAMYMRMKS